MRTTTVTIELDDDEAARVRAGFVAPSIIQRIVDALPRPLQPGDRVRSTVHDSTGGLMSAHHESNSAWVLWDGFIAPTTSVLSQLERIAG
jgi:hypothetical protein